MAAVPEDLRCKRSDGKQWRCSAPSMPDKTVCEKHYVQAKKRSASSALRASLRRSSASSPAPAFPLSSSASSAAAARLGAADEDPPMAVARPLYGRVAGEAVYVAEPVPAPARRAASYEGLPRGNAAGASTAAVSSPLPLWLGRTAFVICPRAQLGSSATELVVIVRRWLQGLVGRGPAWLPGGGAAGIRSCHQCRKAGGVIWCTSCDRRGYCASCISRWYVAPGCICSQ